MEQIFFDRFSRYTSDERIVSFGEFQRFLNECQGDEVGQNKDQLGEFLRKYLREFDIARDVSEPYLSTNEFVEYLFSNENSIFDPINNRVVHDMTRPLTHYWIASSHNTYLTGR